MLISRNSKKEAIKINKQQIYNQPYNLFKNEYHPIMPLKIFQTWHTKNLPPKMREIVDNLKAQNPRFEHHLFDDNDCREFISQHFNKDVVNAYDSLIPGAYKADLWRLCVLFIHGGIYLDIKLQCINGFKLIELTEKNHFVLDRVPPLSIYNALLACQKGHPFLLMGINKIVKHVKNKYYGGSPLSPTGPLMLGKLIYSNKLKLNIDLNHYMGGGFIIYKNRFVISTEYQEYNDERSKQYNSFNTKRYDLLWNERRIYL